MSIFKKNKTEKTGYTTKFNFDEKVFTIHDNSVISFKIDKIHILKESEYSGKYNGMRIWKRESTIFRTKEELIKSL
jgi:hypothetical protein